MGTSLWILAFLVALGSGLPTPQKTQQSVSVKQMQQDQAPSQCHSMEGTTYSSIKLVELQSLVSQGRPEKIGFNQNFNASECCEQKLHQSSPRLCLDVCVERVNKEFQAGDYHAAAYFAMTPYLHQIFADGNRRTGLCASWNVLKNRQHVLPESQFFEVKTKMEHTLAETAGLDPNTPIADKDGATETQNVLIRTTLTCNSTLLHSAITKFAVELEQFSTAVSHASTPPSQPSTTSTSTSVPSSQGGVAHVLAQTTKPAGEEANPYQGVAWDDVRVAQYRAQRVYQESMYKYRQALEQWHDVVTDPEHHPMPGSPEYEAKRKLPAPTLIGVLD